MTRKRKGLLALLTLLLIGGGVTALVVHRHDENRKREKAAMDLREKVAYLTGDRA